MLSKYTRNTFQKQTPEIHMRIPPGPHLRLNTNKYTRNTYETHTLEIHKQHAVERHMRTPLGFEQLFWMF